VSLEIAKKRLLYFPEGERYLYEALPLINKLAQSPDFEVSILIGNEQIVSSQNNRDVMRTLVPSAKLIVVAGWFKFLSAKVEHFNKTTNAQHEYITVLCFPLNLALLFFFYIACHLYSLYLLSQERIDVFAVARDRNMGLSTALLAHSKRLKIRRIVIPWGFFNTNFLLATRRRDSQNSGRSVLGAIARRVMKIIAPKHLLTYEGLSYQYYKLDKFIVGLILGILPKNPFAFGDNADLVCVYGTTTKEILQRFGVSSVIEVTGNQCIDGLALSASQKHARAVEVAAHYGFPGGSKIIAVAVPHMPEHGLISMDLHLKELQSFLSAISELSNVAILLSCHPRSNRNDYSKLASRQNLIIIEHSLHYVLPISSLLVSNYSGVGLWAKTLRIPNLILDWYGLPKIFINEFKSEITYLLSRDHQESTKIIGNLLDNIEPNGREYQPDNSAITNIERAILNDLQCSNN
jgi:hypothetical protein